MSSSAIWSNEAEFVSLLNSIHAPSVSKLTSLSNFALDHHRYYKHIVAQIEKYIKKAAKLTTSQCDLTSMQFKSSREELLCGLYMMDCICKASKAKFNEKDSFVGRFQIKLQSTLEFVVDALLMNGEQPAVASASLSYLHRVVKLISVWEEHQWFEENIIAEAKHRLEQYIKTIEQNHSGNGNANGGGGGDMTTNGPVDPRRGVSNTSPHHAPPSLTSSHPHSTDSSLHFAPASSSSSTALYNQYPTRPNYSPNPADPYSHSQSTNAVSTYTPQPAYAAHLQSTSNGYGHNPSPSSQSQSPHQYQPIQYTQSSSQQPTPTQPQYAAAAATSNHYGGLPNAASNPHPYGVTYSTAPYPPPSQAPLSHPHPTSAYSAPSYAPALTPDDFHSRTSYVNQSNHSAVVPNAAAPTTHSYPHPHSSQPTPHPISQPNYSPYHSASGPSSGALFAPPASTALHTSSPPLPPPTSVSQSAPSAAVPVSAPTSLPSVEDDVYSDDEEDEAARIEQKRIRMQQAEAQLLAQKSQSQSQSAVASAQGSQVFTPLSASTFTPSSSDFNPPAVPPSALSDGIVYANGSSITAYPSHIVNPSSASSFPSSATAYNSYDRDRVRDRNLYDDRDRDRHDDNHFSSSSSSSSSSLSDPHHRSSGPVHPSDRGDHNHNRGFGFGDRRGSDGVGRRSGSKSRSRSRSRSRSPIAKRRRDADGDADIDRDRDRDRADRGGYAKRGRGGLGRVERGPGGRGAGIEGDTHPGYAVLEDQSDTPPHLVRVISTIVFVFHGALTLPVTAMTSALSTAVSQHGNIESIKAMPTQHFIKMKTRAEAETVFRHTQGSHIEVMADGQSESRRLKCGWGRGSYIDKDEFEEKTGVGLVKSMTHERNNKNYSIEVWKRNIDEIQPLHGLHNEGGENRRRTVGQPVQSYAAAHGIESAAAAAAAAAAAVSSSSFPHRGSGSGLGISAGLGIRDRTAGTAASAGANPTSSAEAMGLLASIGGAGGLSSGSNPTLPQFGFNATSFTLPTPPSAPPGLFPPGVNPSASFASSSFVSVPSSAPTAISTSAPSSIPPPAPPVAAVQSGHIHPSRLRQLSDTILRDANPPPGTNANYGNRPNYR